METFIQLFNSIKNKSGLIHTYHKLFGGKRYRCEKLQVICDSNRLGVKIQGKDLYIPKADIKIFNNQDNVFSFASENQMITVYVNKL